MNLHLHIQPKPPEDLKPYDHLLRRISGAPIRKVDERYKRVLRIYGWREFRIEKVDGRYR